MAVVTEPLAEPRLQTVIIIIIAQGSWPYWAHFNPPYWVRRYFVALLGTLESTLLGKTLENL